MREDKKVTGAVNFDDGRLLFELIEIDGVTHADMIDLNRVDIKGFDVREFYVQMLAELKERGY